MNFKGKNHSLTKLLSSVIISTQKLKNISNTVLNKNFLKNEGKLKR